jgi:hypothetical protein
MFNELVCAAFLAASGSATPVYGDLYKCQHTHSSLSMNLIVDEGFAQLAVENEGLPSSNFDPRKGEIFEGHADPNINREWARFELWSDTHRPARFNIKHQTLRTLPPEFPVTIRFGRPRGLDGMELAFSFSCSKVSK